MYNIKQTEAIQSKEKEIVITAPPGSGKTHTMVGAVNEFLKDDSAQDVVVITFTNKAADDLAAKLVFSNRVRTSTIHSWSYSELHKLSEKHEFRIRLLSESAVKEILQPYMRQYRVQSTYINALYHFVMGNVNPDLPHYVVSKYKAIRERYIQYKRKMHLYDFTDLPLYLKTKLEDHDEYIEVDGLFVDEFQDVDPDQLSVFNRVMAKKKFFIGDTDQAIYIFRGATEEIFSQLPGYSRYRLNTNYRSYQEILNFAYDFKKQAPDWITKTMFYDVELHGVVAERGYGATIIQEVSPGFGVRYQNGSEVKGPIKEMVLEELKKHTYQFLCRTNREVKLLQKMGLENVSTIHQAKGLEYDNVAVIDFESRVDEDLNVAFVALTRAKNRLMIIDIDDYLKEGSRYKFAF